MDQQCLYRVGELAHLSGVSPRTIDYYTQLGLLQACRRSEGNYRLYGPEAVERLRIIRAYREQGLHLSAIQERLGAGPIMGECAAMQALLEQIQLLVEQMVQKSAEIAEVKPRLSAAAAEDQQVRLALSRAAGDVLHKALMLSGLLASTLGEVGTPMH